MADKQRVRALLDGAVEPLDIQALLDASRYQQESVSAPPAEGPRTWVRSALEGVLGKIAPSERSAAETADKLTNLSDFVNIPQQAFDTGKAAAQAWQGGDKLGLAMSMIPGKADEAAAKAIRAYHGSRSGKMPNITGDRPFYTTTDRAMAQTYADDVPEGVNPLLAEYDIDPTGYMSRDEYQGIMSEHLPPTWAEEGLFPSEAATVEHPGIMAALQQRGAKGVSDLWDFGMDPMMERQVMATIDPSSLKPAQKGIRAYHGTPHDFDKFSLDKIGTGEGAQAYGHGLYFAENEGIAKGYRDQLSGDNVEARNWFRGNEVSDTSEPRAQAYAALQGAGHPDHMRRVINDIEEGIQEGIPASKFLDEYDVSPSLRKAYEAAIPHYEGLSYRHNPGHMYEVNINADPDAFLDWDKPLSEQPQSVRDALAAMDPDTYSPTGGDYDAMEPGAVTYQRLAAQKRDYGIDSGKNGLTALGGAQAGATKDLQGFGIPGIKYLDAGSRGGDGTAGSRNYVVFDENIINIVKKYGLAAAVAGGAITQQDAEEMQRQGLVGA